MRSYPAKQYFKQASLCTGIEARWAAFYEIVRANNPPGAPHRGQCIAQSAPCVGPNYHLYLRELTPQGQYGSQQAFGQEMRLTAIRDFRMGAATIATETFASRPEASLQFSFSEHPASLHSRSPAPYGPTTGPFD